MPAAAPAPAATLEIVRRAVRRVVEATPELRERPALRRRIAESMVRVSLAAADLIGHERELDGKIAAGALAVEDAAAGEADRPAAPQRRQPALATGQAAGDINRQTAVRAAAPTLQAVKDAIDFPSFVTSLITGVFQAMTTSNLQQLEAYANLLEGLSASASDFGSQHITQDRAALWAAQRFPQLEAVPGRNNRPATLRVREGSEMPDAKEIQSVLGADSTEASSVDDGDLNGTLLPLVQRKLARDRQSMLATMVLLGMNRIVVDQGRIHASMDLQVDARSIAEQQTAERSDFRLTTGGSGSFGMGAWGASASMSMSVGYVKSDQQYSKEDLAVRAGLRSSVDMQFHTESIGLDRMAQPGQVRHIEQLTPVPAAWENRTSLLSGPERNISQAEVAPAPAVEDHTAAVGSQEWQDQRRKRDWTPQDQQGGGAQGGGGGEAGGGEAGAGAGGGATQAGAGSQAGGGGGGGGATQAGGGGAGGGGGATQAGGGGSTQAGAGGQTGGGGQAGGGQAGGGGTQAGAGGQGGGGQGGAGGQGGGGRAALPRGGNRNPAPAGSH